MSSVKIEGNASGTGVFTIASPNSNTNRTLTLPDNTGTILTSATTTGFPAGSVIQVVSATYSTSTTTTSSSFQDTGLSVTITPTSSSSKILILVHLGDGASNNGGSQNGMQTRLVRGSTQVAARMTAQHSYGATGALLIAQAGFVYLDSPATTSSTTYKVQFCSAGGSSTTVWVFRDDTQGSIIAMEIAA